MRWLIASKQLGRFLLLAGVIQVAGPVVVHLSNRGGGLRAPSGLMTKSAFLLDMGCVVAWILAFALLTLVIRCPSCDERVFWWAVGKQPFPGGLREFLRLSACPKCGFPEQQNDP